MAVQQFNILNSQHVCYHILLHIRNYKFIRLRK